MARVALIAHDEKKPDIIDLVSEYEATLADWDLLGTGTTGQRITEETDLTVERKASGPLGGDVQIASEVADGAVDGIVFLRDSLTAQPHEPDISALLRVCDVHDVPLATTETGARYLLDGLGAE
ncbi:methylglyoxal synthase [Halorientalis salina]|uniref:methylglyoxal synthase n=1 Tax=Halorientalis salina TaxID=2932266 RepID=UPI0010AD37B6|nr:methylglyoxal synthase [Halorientalis salina]